MKRHYEKVITACCFLFLFTNIGLPSTSFGVYQPYIVQIVGDTGGMVVLAVRTLVALAAIAFVDRYYNLLDCRMGIAVATLLTSAGFAIYSIAASLPLFAAAAAITGLGYGLGGMAGATMLTRRWYAGPVGGALGFATVGSGIASIAIPIVAVRIIENVSLAASFRFECALSLVVGVAVLVLLRNRPEDIGATPAGAASTADAAVPAEGGAQPAPNAAGNAEGGRTRALPIGSRITKLEYRLVIVATVCVGVMSVGGPAYATVLFTDSGISPVLAASLLSLEGVALTVAKFAVGNLFDAVGTGRGSAIMFVVVVAGLAAFCLVGLGLPALAPAAVILFGAGMTLGTLGTSIWSLDFAQPGNVARSIRNFQVAYSLGGFLTNTFPGPLKEATGSYLTAYAVFLVVSVFAAIVIVGVYHKYRERSRSTHLFAAS